MALFWEEANSLNLKTCKTKPLQSLYSPSLPPSTSPYSFPSHPPCTSPIPCNNDPRTCGAYCSGSCCRDCSGRWWRRVRVCILGLRRWVCSSAFSLRLSAVGVGMCQTSWVESFWNSDGLLFASELWDHILRDGRNFMDLSLSDSSVVEEKYAINSWQLIEEAFCCTIDSLFWLAQKRGRIRT